MAHLGRFPCNFATNDGSKEIDRMILYALCFGFAALGLSYLLTIWRLASGLGIADGEWALDMIPINAVVMMVLLSTSVAI